MRAAVALAAVALVAAALAGCGRAGDGTSSFDATTGLVLSLHYDRSNVETVALSGATAAARRFGPYVVSEDDLPRNSTVGFVFDAGDAGMAMICGEAHDSSGNALASGCDTFDIVGGQVGNGTLTLYDSH